MPAGCCRLQAQVSANRQQNRQAAVLFLYFALLRFFVPSSLHHKQSDILYSSSSLSNSSTWGYFIAPSQRKGPDHPKPRATVALRGRHHGTLQVVRPAVVGPGAVFQLCPSNGSHWQFLMLSALFDYQASSCTLEAHNTARHHMSSLHPVPDQLTKSWRIF